MPDTFDLTPEFARQSDQKDPLQHFKQAFHFPRHQDRDVIYFCGNSLGLQPKNVAAAMQTELDTWRKMAVGGYFSGPNPWLYYQHYVQSSLARLMGCHENEVTVMNTLTVNLHGMSGCIGIITPVFFKVICRIYIRLVGPVHLCSDLHRP